MCDVSKRILWLAGLWLHFIIDDVFPLSADLQLCVFLLFLSFYLFVFFVVTWFAFVCTSLNVVWESDCAHGRWCTVQLSINIITYPTRCQCWRVPGRVILSRGHVWAIPLPPGHLQSHLRPDQGGRVPQLYRWILLQQHRSALLWDFSALLLASANFGRGWGRHFTGRGLNCTGFICNSTGQLFSGISWTSTVGFCNFWEGLG